MEGKTSPDAWNPEKTILTINRFSLSLCRKLVQSISEAMLRSAVERAIL